ncbi:NAD-dependent epimerase/dehydratase family protein [Pseudomonas panipatensis]|uniref:UDP-glucose 4-epimerase n=1 Tax=Pseudomonas panipatensis TaxID=428992 RepID=A0A1G8K1Z5_9PSED|nr:NAD-dependent epimerase/dehydratase family protein [Pseudomonas panipatensis]SDI37423.1 UDP-glucose 4-epimerase [Pseudomonas panipatensis]SMP61197.1 UDP-glucose 4-epimerase [Pseudomonas panipatensis]
MKIAIFGGGGFIGSAIADRLLKDGHQLKIFERPRVPPYREFSVGEHVEWLTGDLMSTHDVSEVLEGVDTVLHLVSTTLPKSSNDDPIYDVQTNLIATLQMLNLMVAKGVRKIVFISSGGTVYGPPTYLPIDEKHPTEPQVSYGITKLMIEKYLLMYQHLHGIKANILRVTNPYGERQRVETAQGAVGVFLNRALQGQPIDIWGDGSVTRDYIHVSDVAEAFAKAAAYDGPESVFNISSGTGTSLNELVGQLEKVLGKEIRRNYLPGRSFDVPVSVLCNQRARRELDWNPAISLEEGLQRTVAWMKQASR